MFTIRNNAHTIPLTAAEFVKYDYVDVTGLEAEGSSSEISLMMDIITFQKVTQEQNAHAFL